MGEDQSIGGPRMPWTRMLSALDSQADNATKMLLIQCDVKGDEALPVTTQTALCKRIHFPGRLPTGSGLNSGTNALHGYGKFKTSEVERLRRTDPNRFLPPTGLNKSRSIPGTSKDRQRDPRGRQLRIAASRRAARQQLSHGQFDAVSKINQRLCRERPLLADSTDCSDFAICCSTASTNLSENGSVSIPADPGIQSNGWERSV